MKCVILAGGRGARISEETINVPKPMISIGGKPIIWHIMQHYSRYGVKDFIICTGYKSENIKNFFVNYKNINSNVHINMKTDSVTYEPEIIEDWNVSIVDTGLETNTGGRIKRIKKYLNKDEIFLLTYGDGLGNINIRDLIKFHESHKKLVTLTAAIPEGRFGAILIDKENKISSIKEKQDNTKSFVNGGFFVLSNQALDYIHSDKEQWENEPLSRISEIGELMAFKHYGFWHPMDTLRDKIYLDKLADQKTPPWES